MMQSIQSYTMIQEAGLTPSCQQVSLKDGGHDMIWTKDASGHFCTIHWHHNNAVIHCCLIWTQIRPILLAACHTLDEQVMSGYPRSETSRIKQHPVILTVVLGLLKMKMISLFCTWLDNGSFWGRPYFLLRLARSGTLHWGRQYGWKSGWAEVPTTLAVVDPSSNFLAYFRPQYHVWSPLESHLNNVNVCWTIFGLTVAFLAARLGWHSLGLCLQRQVLRNTLHRPGLDWQGGLCWSVSDSQARNFCQKRQDSQCCQCLFCHWGWMFFLAGPCHLVCFKLWEIWWTLNLCLIYNLILLTSLANCLVESFRWSTNCCAS